MFRKHKLRKENKVIKYCFKIKITISQNRNHLHRSGIDVEIYYFSFTKEYLRSNIQQKKIN